MILQIFSIFDSKAEAYMPPFFFNARGQAIRAFEDLANDNSSSINNHPGDFTLYHIGSFDDVTAELEIKNHTSLGCAIELKKEHESSK